MKLIIYMPAFNEEKNLALVIDQLPKAITQIDEILILVVDDGSNDETRQVALLHGAHVVSHHQNKGVGVAFQSAVQFALENKADILVSIDADRQFSGNQIPDLIQPLLKYEADMVIGNRFSKGRPNNMSSIKYWGNKQMSRLISRISRNKLQDVSSGFRAYNKEALLRLNLIGTFTYTQETILDMINKGLNVVEIPVTIRYFRDRKSKVATNIFTYAFRTSKIIFRTVRDYKPMLFFGIIGSISMIIGAFFTIFMLIHYFINGTFTPYKSFGFIGLGFFVFGILVVIVGLLADMFNRVLINQERILYELKKHYFDE